MLASSGLIFNGTSSFTQTQVKKINKSVVSFTVKPQTVESKSEQMRGVGCFKMSKCLPFDISFPVSQRGKVLC